MSVSQDSMSFDGGPSRSFVQRHIASHGRSQMTQSVQNREQMLMLAEMRSHGSAWNHRKGGDRTQLIRHSPRRGNKQSPLN